jgi:transposase-like protein
MAVLAGASAESLNLFITGAVEPGSTVITDAWQGYSGLRSLGCTRERRSQRAARASGEDPAELLPNVHRVAALARRWLLGTHHGSVDEAHMPAYLNEFVFRFNRRSSRSRGLVFYRVLELAAGHDPVRFRDLLAGKKPRPAPATWGLGHPPTLERPAANRPWRTGGLQLQLPIPLRLSKYPRHSVMRCLARSDIPVCPSVDCLWRQAAHRTQSPNCRTWIAGTASPPMAWHLIFLKAVAPVGVDGPNADCIPGPGLVTGARARRHRTSRLAAPTPAAAGAR